MLPPPDPRPTPLALAIVAEAVRRIEAEGPLDDRAELRRAFEGAPTRAAQIGARAWALGERLGLPAELARWRQAGAAVVLALALVLVLSGLGLARAVLGEGRSINALAALVSLLGLHALTLAAWLAAVLLMPLARGRWRAPWSIGRAALWLAARLPGGRTPHAPVLLEASTAVLARRGLLTWLTGAIAHGVWSLAFAIMLLVLAFGFAFHAYTLTWESTILGAPFFQRVVQVSGWLPALVGFPVPDAAAVARAGSGSAGGTSQREWAWWLMGCVAVYGLAPRLVLAAVCGAMWRAGRQRAVPLDLADPYAQRLVARLNALEPQPAVVDAERPWRPAAHGVPGAAARGAPGTLAAIGFELAPEAPWPPAALAATLERALWHQRIAGSAAERQAALDRLAAERPESLLVVVGADASPDRGTARLLRDAAAHGVRIGLLPLDDTAPAAADGPSAASPDTGAVPTHVGAARWRDWLAREGVDGVAFVASPEAAADWVARVADGTAAGSAP